MSRARGTHWERVAERWLRRQGARVITRNFSSRIGEIDLIVRDGKDIAFVEVKYRSNSGFGSGAEHVTRIKQQRLVNTARTWVAYHKHAPAQVFRFDVVSIGNGRNGHRIQWIKNAFEAV